MPYILPTQELGIALWRAQGAHMRDVLTDNDYALADDGGDYVTSAIELARAMNYICRDGVVNITWLDSLLNTPGYLANFFACDAIALAFYELGAPALIMSMGNAADDPFAGTGLAQ